MHVSSFLENENKGQTKTVKTAPQEERDKKTKICSHKAKNKWKNNQTNASKNKQRTASQGIKKSAIEKKGQQKNPAKLGGAQFFKIKN